MHSATRPATRLAPQRTGQGPNSRRRPPSILTHQTNWTAWMLTTSSPWTTSGPATPPMVRVVLPKRPTMPAVIRTSPWFRVIDAHRKKFVVEEASATPPATIHQRKHRHGTGRPRLRCLPVEDHKGIFHIRGGISLQQEAVLPWRAAI
ncbi:hypothetical protein MRX96_021064 [Rhipicephalus microplus]